MLAFYSVTQLSVSLSSGTLTGELEDDRTREALPQEDISQKNYGWVDSGTPPPPFPLLPGLLGDLCGLGYFFFTT